MMNLQCYHVILFVASLIVSTAHGFVVTPPPCSAIDRSPAGTTLHYTPEASSIDSSSIRFLGKGASAIVRPGVVLIAPTEEYNHYLMRAAIFVYAMGLDENDEYVIRAVVLDNPTPFTMGEMAKLEGTPLADYLLYRGGNVGGETAMMLHSIPALEKEEIGTSGIYEGGLQKATDGSVEIQETSFKFFFNYCEFSPDELEQILEEVDPDTGDGWMSVEVPTDVVLEEWDKNDCWRFLRNVVKTRFLPHEEGASKEEE